MSNAVKSGLTVSALILISFWFTDFWWDRSFETKEGNAYEFTRYGFVPVFFLIYNSGWGLLSAIINIFKSLFNFLRKKEHIGNQRAGAWIVVFLGLILGGIWGLLCGMLTNYMGVFEGIYNIAQLGFIYGLAVYILIKLRLIIVSSAAAGIFLDAATGGHPITEVLEAVPEDDEHLLKKDRQNDR